MAEKSRFTSDRRAPASSSWTGDTDWAAGTAENVGVSDGGLVVCPPKQDSGGLGTGGVHQWSINAGGESTWEDVSGSADVSLTGTTWRSDPNAVGGYVTEFDGVDEQGSVSTNRVDVGDVGTAVVTFEFLDPVTDSFHKGFWHQDTANKNRVYLYARDGYFGVGLTDDPFLNSRVAGLSTNTKYRFGLSWDSGSYESWLNGVEQSTGTYVGSIESATNEPWEWGSTDGVRMRLDNPIVDSVVWTGSEWQNDYDNQPWA